MLGDAISAKKGSGEAAESLEVVDVAQLLGRSVAPAAGAVAATGSGGTPDGKAGPADVSGAGQDGPGAAEG
jgi:hypothetical protein